MAGILGPSPARESQEREIAGATLEQRGARGLVGSPDQQMAFPMPGNGPVVSLGRALIEHPHRPDEALLPPLDPAAGFAQESPVRRLRVTLR